MLNHPFVCLFYVLSHSDKRHGTDTAEMAGKASSDMPDPSRVYSIFTNLTETQSTVILGAGIIGCATAYYLSRSGNTKPDTIHLIEASPELFASASGKSGGFVVSDCML